MKIKHLRKSFHTRAHILYDLCHDSYRIGRRDADHMLYHVLMRWYKSPAASPLDRCKPGYDDDGTSLLPARQAFLKG
jgi:hypothetical protein